MRSHPRRLLMIVHGPYPIGEPRVEQQALAAVRSGFEVEVLALAREGEKRREIVDGIEVTRAGMTHRRGQSVLATALEYVRFALVATAAVASRTLRAPLDIVHVHAPPDFLLVAALPARLRGARIVLDIHDRSPDLFAARFGGRFAAPLLGRMEKLAAALADAVLTVHEPYRRALLAAGLPPRKISVVMNSPRPELLPKRRPRAAGGPLRAVYHGTIAPWYGVGTIVDAIARLGDVVPVTLDVWGEGDAATDVRRRAEACGFSDRIVLHGQRPRAEVLRHVAEADVGVIPNLPTDLNRFALSTKVLELVAIGVPVVCADLPTIREHFSDEELLYFEPGNPASLAAALADVARGPAGAVARAEAARRRFRAYAWEISERVYLDVLDRLAK